MSKYDFEQKVADRVIKAAKNKVANDFKALERLEIEYVKPDSIFPNDYNPNQQNAEDFEMLMRSITDDGFTQPIIVQREGRVIVDGFHRWRVAIALNYPEVPVVFVDMAEAQRRISTLRHNRARGREDLTLTADLLREIDQLGGLADAQAGLIMSESEISRLVGECSAAATLASESYSQAWNPSRIGDDVAGSTETKSFGIGGMAISSTPAAAGNRRDLEQQLSQAQTREEQQTLHQKIEVDTFRIQLLFERDEAKIIRAVLGTQPASKVLELCRPIWEAQEGLRLAEEARMLAEKVAKEEAKVEVAAQKEKTKQTAKLDKALNAQLGNLLGGENKPTEKRSASAKAPK